MFCAISGEVPQEPYVSRTTGHLYEKRLIEKYVEENRTCPVTGKDASIDDFIPLQANKVIRPRPITTTSIPSLLASFQNEWDEVMLETFTLKQSLDTTRQELSQALYQHDAACRVIARLMRERDEARAALSALQEAGYTSQPRNGQAQADMDTDSAPAEIGLDEAVLTKISEKCAELSASRKGRKFAAEGLLSKETIGGLKPVASHTPHKADKGAIYCVAVDFSSEDGPIVTGGADKELLLFNKNDGSLTGRLSGHTKKITDVAFRGKSDIIFSSSADKTVKVWAPPRESMDVGVVNYDELATFKHHDGEVTAISVHPTGDFVVSMSLDRAWAFVDVERGACLRRVSGEEELTSGQFHPDGLILGSGAAQGGFLKIWDVREQQAALTFDAHQGGVNCLCFSENGYMLASAGEDGTAKVWDLRKQKCVKSFEFGSPVTAVSFDPSALYLSAASGTPDDSGSFSARIYAVKGWADVGVVSGHSKPITDLAWGPKSSFVVTVSSDRTAKIHANL